MTTATAPGATTAHTDDGDDGLFHLYCCDKNRGLCGADISDVPELDDLLPGDQMCVVCDDLELATCSVCGAFGWA